MKNLIKFALAGFASAALALPAFSADHKEAPLISEDPSADIADIYAFVSPEDASKTVLVMTVNPFSAPTEGVNFNFSPNVLYSFRIDTNGDGKEERTVHTLFSDRLSGGQTYTVFLPDESVLLGDVTEATEEPTPNAAVIASNGGVRAFAGPRDDPFFFDFVGFSRVLAGTGGFSGADSFGGFNVSALVIELPTSMIGGGPDGILGVWGTTARRTLEIHRAPRRSLGETFEGFDFDTFITKGGFRQVERMGNPAVGTLLIPLAQKDLFNATRPRFDGTDFAPSIVASLNAIAAGFGVFPDVATLASVAVSGGDTLKYDPNVFPTAFPFGRAPADDVIDTLLSLIFQDDQGNPVLPAGDLVDANDVDFQAAFPFLAPPQQPQ